MADNLIEIILRIQDQASDEIKELIKSLSQLSARVTVVGEAAAEAGAKAEDAIGPLPPQLVAITNLAQNVRDALTGITAAMDAAIQSSRDLGRSWALIKTLLPNEDIDKLRESVIALANAYSVDATVASDAFKEILSAGYSEPIAALELLTAATRGAVASGSDLGAIANGLLTVMAAWGGELGSSAVAMDKLAKLLDIGRGSLNEVARGMASVAPLAASMSISMEEVSAILARLTTSGKPVAEAYTSIKAALEQILNPTEAASAVLKKAGYASGELAVRQLGLIGTLGLLADAGKGSTDALAKFSSSSEAVPVLIEAASDRIGSLRSAFDDLNNAVGKNAESLSLLKGAAQFDVLEKNLSNLSQVTGLVLQKSLADSVGVMNALIQSAVSLVGTMPNLVSGLLLMAAAAGSTAVVLVSLITASAAIAPTLASAATTVAASAPIVAAGITTMAAGISTFSAAAIPFVVGVGALVVVVLALRAAWASLSSIFDTSTAAWFDVKPVDDLNAVMAKTIEIAATVAIALGGLVVAAKLVAPALIAATGALLGFQTTAAGVAVALAPTLALLSPWITALIVGVTTLAVAYYSTSAAMAYFSKQAANDQEEIKKYGVTLQALEKQFGEQGDAATNAKQKLMDYYTARERLNKTLKDNPGVSDKDLASFDTTQLESYRKTLTDTIKQINESIAASKQAADVLGAGKQTAGAVAKIKEIGFEIANNTAQLQEQNRQLALTNDLIVRSRLHEFVKLSTDEAKQLRDVLVAIGNTRFDSLEAKLKDGLDSLQFNNKISLHPVGGADLVAAQKAYSDAHIRLAKERANYELAIARATAVEQSTILDSTIADEIERAEKKKDVLTELNQTEVRLQQSVANTIRQERSEAVRAYQHYSEQAISYAQKIEDYERKIRYGSIAGALKDFADFYRRKTSIAAEAANAEEEFQKGNLAEATKHIERALAMQEDLRNQAAGAAFVTQSDLYMLDEMGKKANELGIKIAQSGKAAAEAAAAGAKQQETALTASLTAAQAKLEEIIKDGATIPLLVSPDAVQAEIARIQESIKASPVELPVTVEMAYSAGINEVKTQLGEVAKTILSLKPQEIKISADTSAFDSSFNRILADINKSYTIQINAKLNKTGGGYARGGYLASGPGTTTSDSIPAWLSRGEYVIRAAAVKHYGADLFHRLNSIQLKVPNIQWPRFADGGIVNSISPAIASAGASAASPSSVVELRWSDTETTRPYSLLGERDAIESLVRGIQRFNRRR